MIRPELEHFANLMEDKLKQNEHKGGWKEESIEFLKMYMILEYHEVREAFQKGSPDEIIDECVDLANYCMMIVDVLSLKKEV